MLPNTLQSFWKVILESNSTGSKLKSGEWNDTRTHMHTHKAWEWCKLNYSFSMECIPKNIQRIKSITQRKTALNISVKHFGSKTEYHIC